jgi:uncharacterized protein YwgA
MDKFCKNTKHKKINLKHLILNRIDWVIMNIDNSNSDKIRLLASILNKIGNFDMSTFDGRLIFQKTVYFLQVFKIYLGYHFSLYIRGPYSPELAKDGFELSNKVKTITEFKFSDKKMEQNFSKFISFIEQFKDNPSNLEILSSLHLFKNLFPNDDKNMIIKRVLQYKPYLRKETCENCWNVLEKFNLV